MVSKKLLIGSIFFALLINFLLIRYGHALYNDTGNTYTYSDLRPYRLTTGKPGKDTLTAPYRIFIQYVNQMERSGRYDEALNWLDYALMYAKLCRDKGFIPGVYSKMGQIYAQSGKHTQAIRAYELVLENIYCRHNNIHAKSNRYAVFLSICNVYKSLEQYEKALFYCDSALLYFQYDRNYFSLATAQAVKATLCNATGSITQAIQYNLAALESLNKWNDTISYPITDTKQIINQKILVLNNLAYNYLDLHKADSAYFYLQKIKDTGANISPYTRCCIYLTYGGVWQQRGQARKALFYYQEALRIAGHYKFMDRQIVAHQEITKIYDGLGMYKEALLHERQYHLLKDSSVNQKTILQLSELELEKLRSQKDRELTEKQLLLVRQNTKIKNRNLWVILSSIGFFFSLGYILLIYRNNRHKQSLQDAQLENLRYQHNIYALQGKLEGEEQERGRIAVELHDGILSQLMALQMHINILQNRSDNYFNVEELGEIREQVELATHDLRRTAHNLMPDLLLHQGWEDAVGALCEKTQRYAHIATSFQVIGNITTIPQQHALTLYRIVQELIQNVLKHADASELTVQISQRESSLGITIEDNGNGFYIDQVQTSPENGLGLVNIRRRVEMLHGDMDIRSIPGKGTTIYIEIDTNAIPQDTDNTESALLNNK